MSYDVFASRMSIFFPHQICLSKYKNNKLVEIKCKLPPKKENGLNTITCILFQLSTPVMSFPADGRVNYSILEKEEMKDEKEKQVD